VAGLAGFANGLEVGHVLGDRSPVGVHLLPLATPPTQFAPQSGLGIRRIHGYSLPQTGPEPGLRPA